MKTIFLNPVPENDLVDAKVVGNGVALDPLLAYTRSLKRTVDFN